MEQQPNSGDTVEPMAMMETVGHHSVPATEIHCDVLVVGGGPGGASCAALLAQEGYDVVVCERERFPRFHVGESLLPRGNQVLKRLGLLERCEQAGWTSKPGASFLFEDAVGALDSSNGSYERNSAAERGARHAWCSIHFADALGLSEQRAFQVPRASFDEMLLARAKEFGVRVFESWQLREVCFKDGVTAQIQQRICESGPADEGSGGCPASTVNARFLVDASGQSGFLAKRLNLRRPDKELVNLASFAHYTGWRWPGSIHPGNIQVISRRDLGWLWIIPLNEDRVSVGLVEPASRAARGKDRTRKLEAALRESALLREQSASAERVSDVFGVADFGYGAAKYSGDNWILVGDAGSFVDPVFSTGVYLALSSGAEAADAVAASLSKPAEIGEKARAHYGRVQRRRYEFFRRFVLKYYDPGMRDLLCQRRDLLRLPDALSSILAGDWQPPWRVRWRLETFYLLAKLQGWVPLVEQLHRQEST